MEYRRLGRSGLEVSIVCLGTMMFGDRTDAPRAQRDRRARARRRRQLHRHGRRVRRRARRRRITGAAIKAQRARWILATKVGNVDGGDERGRTPAARRGAGSSRRATTASRASAPTTSTSTTCTATIAETPIEETVARDGRPDPRGQDPLLRRVELPRLAHRRSDALVRAAGRAAAGRLPAVLQPAEPDARSRDPARLRSTTASASRRIRRSRAACSPGKYCAGRVAGGFARRAQGPADDGNGISRGIVRDRATR